jgi:hypothetical protein
MRCYELKYLECVVGRVFKGSRLVILKKCSARDWQGPRYWGSGCKTALWKSLDLDQGDWSADGASVERGVNRSSYVGSDQLMCEMHESSHTPSAVSVQNYRTSKVRACHSLTDLGFFLIF